MTSYQDQPLSRREIREREAAARGAEAGPTTDAPVPMDAAAGEPLDYATRSRAPIPPYDAPLSQPSVSELPPDASTAAFRYRDYSPEAAGSAPTFAQHSGSPADLDYRTLNRPDGAVPQPPMPEAHMPEASVPPAPVVDPAAAPQQEATMSRRELRALREAQERAGGASTADSPEASRAPSVAPVSVAPESVAPMSDVPGSGAPVSVASMSGAPVSAGPVSVAPVSDAPLSGAPVWAAPVSAAPVSVPPAAASPEPASPVTSWSSAASAPALPVSAAPVPAASAPPAPPPLVEPAAPSADAAADLEALFRAQLGGGFSTPPAASSAAPAPVASMPAVPLQAPSVPAAPPVSASAAPVTSAAPAFAAPMFAAPVSEASVSPASASVAPVSAAPVAPVVAPDVSVSAAPVPFEALFAEPASTTDAPAPAFPLFGELLQPSSPFDPVPGAPVPASGASQSSAPHPAEVPHPEVQHPEVQAASASQQPVAAERPRNHWSRQAELDDEAQPATGGLVRDVGSRPTTSNALVLPASLTPDIIAGPIAGGGEMLVTGSISLPASLASTGALPAQLDESDLDNLLDPRDQQVSSTDSQPVRAIRAVSTHTSSREIIGATRPKRGSRALTALIVAAVGMAAVVVTLLVVALTSGVLG